MTRNLFYFCFCFFINIYFSFQFIFSPTRSLRQRKTSVAQLSRLLKKREQIPFGFSLNKRISIYKNLVFLRSDSIDGTYHGLLANSTTSERCEFETLVNISILYIVGKRICIKQPIIYRRTRVRTDVTTLTSSFPLSFFLSFSSSFSIAYAKLSKVYVIEEKATPATDPPIFPTHFSAFIRRPHKKITDKE